MSCYCALDNTSSISANPYAEEWLNYNIFYIEMLLFFLMKCGKNVKKLRARILCHGHYYASVSCYHIIQYYSCSVMASRQIDK